jgi:hypothetical protein
MRSIRRSIVGVSLAVAVILGAAGTASAHPKQLAETKRALRPFHSVQYAKNHGFGLVTDVNGVSCIDDPAGTGNMGYHYANATLLTDGKIDRLHPEAVLYERRNHRLHLTAIEYIVIVDQWGANKPPPVLYGQEFMKVDAPNRFGLPAFYMLHVWLWKNNPLGLFNPYNPRVHCP